jgi:glycosyltransferase involved in cell wall biosynthesis
MATRPKLLCWSDFGCNTGFARVANSLYDELYKDFETYILGINYHGLKTYDTSKYFVFPISNDDPFGYQRMGYVLHTVQPDIVFLFQDIFNVQTALPIVKQVVPKAKIVSYYPVDGSPVSRSWAGCFKPDVIHKHITYSKWAVDEIKTAIPEAQDLDIGIMYHGVEEGSFLPLRKFQIKQIKRERGLDDKFIAINVNRFQPRKMIALTVSALAMFRHGYYIDKDGNYICKTVKRHPLQHYDLRDEGVIVKEIPGHEDFAAILHMNNVERIMGPPKACTLAAMCRNTGWQDEDFGNSLFFPLQDIMSNPIPDDALNEVYNIADVNISAAVGEGCGLSLIEASATGTTSIAPHNSAIPEMLGNTGYLCKNITTFNMGLDNSHMRPLVDVRELVKALETEYQKWCDNGRKKVFNQEAVDRVNTLFRWPDKRQFLRDALLSVL